MSISRLYWRRSLRHLPSSCRRISQAAAAATTATEPGATAAASRPYNIRAFQVPALYGKEQDEYIRQKGFHDATPEEMESGNINDSKKLYSARGMRIAWFDYQERMLNVVNQKITERGLEGDIKDIAIQTSRNPSEASLFNHASMAFNNDFYFKGIQTSMHQPMPAKLNEALVTDFGTIDSFKAEMLAMAEAMFGPGYVWLVRSNTKLDISKKEFQLLATYIAGSPLPGAHRRRQPVDMNTEDVNDAIAAGGVEALSRQRATLPQHKEVQNTVGSLGKYSKRNVWPKPAFGGADLVPCLCVSTWEHSYIADWGFNKRQFLSRWWDFINWEHVYKLSGVEYEGPSMNHQAGHQARLHRG